MTQPTGATATLRHVQRVADRRHKIDAERHAATAELRELCLRAHNEGVTITAIAEVSCLSSQGVYDLLAGEAPLP